MLIVRPTERKRARGVSVATAMVQAQQTSTGESTSECGSQRVKSIMYKLRVTTATTKVQTI